MDCRLRRKGSIDLMFMSVLSESIEELAIANGVCLPCDVLRREDDHVLRRALYFEVEGQGKKWWMKMTWKKQIVEESVKVGLRREDALCQSKLSVGVNQLFVICPWK